MPYRPKPSDKKTNFPAPFPLTFHGKGAYDHSSKLSQSDQLDGLNELGQGFLAQ